MIKEGAKSMDYSRYDADITFSRIVVHVRVKAGQTLRVRIRARWCMIDWGDGEWQRGFSHRYTVGGFWNINIVGNRINWLDVEGWNVVDLNLDRCFFLSRLCCQGNNLKRLNLLNCPALVYLDCSYNQIENLQLTGLKKLKEVKANNNRLKVVDFSACSQLLNIDLNNNLILVMVILGCKKLKNLGFEDTEFNPEDFKNEAENSPALFLNERGIGILGRTFCPENGTKGPSQNPEMKRI